MEATLTVDQMKELKDALGALIDSGALLERERLLAKSMRDKYGRLISTSERRAWEGYIKVPMTEDEAEFMHSIYEALWR